MNVDFLEKLESALCEKCDVDHSDCIGENECFCTLDMARAYRKGRADAIDECITLARAEIDFESQAEQKRFVEFMKSLKEKKDEMG